MTVPNGPLKKKKLYVNHVNLQVLSGIDVHLQVLIYKYCLAPLEKFNVTSIPVIYKYYLENVYIYKYWFTRMSPQGGGFRRFSIQCHVIRQSQSLALDSSQS